ncbi:dTDP-4-dehydrorhamnose reductase [Rubellimicrobium sp. CFH 75288]|uniref:dTDP-4-dehydrorhamnose reductase n=1 Tax=Rubellimicrobium sp. CFH 75288 TaxID=2697034 RepID=UPI001411CB5D|nr:dTDP-4-dehydrorhamnose reductase [Rubellimicrobium sp. CFH 75288]NAZ36168.1 dTDP-4-dehydrorhamnose reductase [Rubellimicrobium sp. CFH 75288]
MRLLLFGATGQVGRAVRRLAPAGTEVVAPGRDIADLSDPDSCARAVRDLGAEAIINAAAWTAVDRAEAEEVAARVVNAEAPGAIAREAARRGLPVVHISTDYVFPGTGEVPWQPGDRPDPPNAYGRTKLAGEQAVAEAGGPWVVLRTSWVFGAEGANFVRTMLRLGRERQRVRVVADQIGGPTPADAVARTCLALALALRDGAASGIHHLSGAPDTSWAGFAEAVFAEAGLPVAVEPIATAEFPTPARRPLNSRLDCRSLRRDFGIERPDWRAALPAVVTEILSSFREVGG